MLFALVYSWLRLLLDVVDVRFRVHDPEAELLLLRHQLRVVRRQVKRPQLNAADRTIMAALSERVNRSALVGMLVQPETVLGWHRELVKRRWAAFGRPPRPRAAGSRSRAPEADSANGQRQSQVGLRTSPRRVAQARSSGLRRSDPQLAAPEPNRAGTVEIKVYLEGLSASAGLGDRAHRLPQRRHRASEATLRPLIYGARDPVGDLVRGDRQPRCSLGDPASQECELGTEPPRCGLGS